MMEKETIEAAVARVRRMEMLFDALQKAAEQPGTVQSTMFQALLTQLIRYYEGGGWMEDFQMDEQGLLPANLKRGVLSEDGIYNFLEDLKSL